jgi:heme-degrading monooxygenase HmoA
METIADTPSPPYFAVIFTSLRTADNNDYAVTAERMLELAADQPGFLGIESAREQLGITVSYWQSLEDIAGWRQHAEHQLAQANGRNRWYRAYQARIAKVERDYRFDAKA